VDSLRAPADETEHQHHRGDDEENEEENFGDLARTAGDPAHTEYRGDNGDYKKNRGVVEHFQYRPPNGNAGTMVLPACLWPSVSRLSSALHMPERLPIKS
jgi:hypothetical protein